MNYIQGEKFKNIADNITLLYKDTPDVNNLFRNPPSYNFILISHNSDGYITDNPKMYDADVRIMPDNLIKWYGQNVKYKDSRIESIPIGLENSKWFPEIEKIKKIESKAREKRNYINWLYINHNIDTNPIERRYPYLLFNKEKWVTIEQGRNGQNFDNYIDKIYNHRFVLCPEGNGIDTHRTWECLYIGTIPIEKKNINNQYYTDLPICFVESWKDITLPFLISEFERIKNASWNMNKLDFNYWTNKIRKDESLCYHSK